MVNMLPHHKQLVTAGQIANRPLSEYVKETYNGVSVFLKSQWSDRPDMHQYLNDGSLRLSLIGEILLEHHDKIIGPTLDIASEDGLLYPLITALCPTAVDSYALTELAPTAEHVMVQEKRCRSYRFHCERDVFPANDNSFGFLLFCEVLEHLMQDPVWAMVQLNRILRSEGYLLLTTPNAGSILRLPKILSCETAAGFVLYKPIQFYLRHYREYSAKEVEWLLNATGFEVVTMKTGIDRFAGRRWNALLLTLKALRLLSAPIHYYGQTTVCLAKKVSHISSPDELSLDRRWPAWLYSQNDSEHRRPERFLVD